MTRKHSDLGKEIIQGLEEAIAYERGELPGVRSERVDITARRANASSPPEFDAARVFNVRSSLNLSQPVFAAVLNVSPETVRAWEQGKRVPDGAAARLLEVAEEEPAVFARFLVMKNTKAVAIPTRNNRTLERVANGIATDKFKDNSRLNQNNATRIAERSTHAGRYVSKASPTGKSLATRKSLSSKVSRSSARKRK